MIRPTVANVTQLLDKFDLTPSANGTQPVNYRVYNVNTHEAFVTICGIYYHIWDNGGEMGVDMLNTGQLPVFVPTRPELGMSPNAASVAWWIAQLVKGWAVGHQCDVEVDFDERLSDDESEWFK